ncbi:Heat shock 70 kDa protein 4 [Fasciola gigantica]|uniref:Heat shock 70 kDa protein 4 n=1 Tax=Fasciola gigantica TaxID=46835 RepID=A0A504YBY0_FASGI|nr:Heat shock 70 kDa protein 4 [Fasciola gigantica]
MSDVSVLKERSRLLYPVEEGADGRVMIKVHYNDGVYAFTPEQVVAMQLTKLKGLTESVLASKVVDVVINVPTYLTDCERRAMLDASRIAGLNCVKLVNDTTAIGTAYGLYNVDLPAADQPPRNVAFVSVGYHSTQIAIGAFNSGKLRVLSTSCDPHLGGRDFDEVIFEKMAQEFESMYKIKISDYPKAVVRLFAECEKVKKAMSANSQELPVNIECLLNDRDLCSKIKRADFEEYSGNLLSRFEQVLKRCLVLSKLETTEIHSVELVGGTTRIPALKAIVASVFGQHGRTTLNADEAVARGCALQAAICSPAYRVREFNVTEVCPYGINLIWDREDSGDQAITVAAENDSGVPIDNKDTSIEIFPLMHPIPSSRRLFFNRRGPFALEARYSHPENLPNQSVLIGMFKVHGLSCKPGEICKVRVKVRINNHGIFTVSQAEVAEEYEKEVEVEVPNEVGSVAPETTAGKPMEVETPNNGDVSSSPIHPNASTNEANETAATDKKLPAKRAIVKKKATRYRDLPVDASIMQFTPKQLNEFCEIEGKLYEQDELEQKRAHAKNAVEEYVYEMRSKLAESLQPYATEKENSDLSRVLEETEDWLYGDGENLHRQAYVDRLNNMRILGDRIENRAYEHKSRTPAVENFERSIVSIRKVIDSAAAGEDAYNHLTKDQLKQLQSSLDHHEHWLRDQMRVQNGKSLTDDPVLKTADISQNTKLWNLCVAQSSIHLNLHPHRHHLLHRCQPEMPHRTTRRQIIQRRTMRTRKGNLLRQQPMIKLKTWM